MTEPIRLVPRAEKRQDEDQKALVDLLREMLAAAERGEVVGVVVAVEYASGDNLCFSSGCADRYARAGRLEAMKIRVLGQGDVD